MSRSLGVLTLDLVAKVGGFVQGMDKAERSSAKWRKQVSLDIDKAKTASVAGLAAVAAATTAMVASQFKAAAEVSQLAAVSAAGTTEFQRYAVAADTVGINQEKLSDQLKDFNEKLGEFEQSGAGGMKDFFEQIAPQIGITADAFKNLSGPQALQLYYDSLEKAGLSQQQMSFYLESMASDTTALIPLLRDGGAGFKLLGDAAEKAGAIIDDSTIDAADRMSAAVFLVEQATKGFRNQISAELLPVLGDLAAEFSDVSEEGVIAAQVGDVLSFSVKTLAAAAVGAFAALQLVGRGIAGLQLAADAADIKWYDRVIPPLAARKIYKNWDEVKGALDIVGDDLDQTAQTYASALDAIWDAGSGKSGGNSRVDEIARLRREGRDQARTPSGSDSTGLSEEDREREKQRVKTLEGIANEITALERAAKTWGMTADEVKIYDLAAKGATETQVEHARAQLELVTRLEKTKKEQEAYQSLVKDLRTDEERLTDELRERLAVLDAIADLGDGERNAMAGRIADSAFDAESVPQFAGVDAGPLGELSKLDDAEQELNDWYSKQLQMLAVFREERADLSEQWDAQELELKQQHEDAMASIERTRWQTGLTAVSDFLTQTQALRDTDSKKGKAAAKTAAIAQATINAYTAATGAYASASAIPVVGWVLGPVAAAAALAAGLANVSAIKGQAHDGLDFVPSTGTYILERGEKVTTAATSAKLDATLERVNAGMASSGREAGRSRGNVSVNQTINVTGDVDRRTSTQIASDTARRQRIAAARLG